MDGGVRDDVHIPEAMKLLVVTCLPKAAAHKCTQSKQQGKGGGGGQGALQSLLNEHTGDQQLTGRSRPTAWPGFLCLAWARSVLCSLSLCLGSMDFITRYKDEEGLCMEQAAGHNMALAFPTSQAHT